MIRKTSLILLTILLISSVALAHFGENSNVISNIRDSDGDLIEINPNGQVSVTQYTADGEEGVTIVDPEDSTRKIEFDTKHKAPLIIDVEHHEIHEACSHEVHIDSNNAAVASLNVAFKTLAGDKLSHMLFGWSSNDEIRFEVRQGATWTQGTGTIVPLHNHNLNVGSVSTVILENRLQPTFTASNGVIQGVTGISGGTTFEGQFTYNASVGANRQIETRSAGHEWVLKNDTTYVVEMLKTDANCKMSIDLHEYEHTDE